MYATTFTDVHTGRHDGVHMYGRGGKLVYTESVLNILLTTLHNQAQMQRAQQHSTDKFTRIKRKNATTADIRPELETQQKVQVNNSQFDDYHNNCPQTQYQQRRLYSSVISSKPLHTQNRFSLLSNNYQGNY